MVTDLVLVRRLVKAPEKRKGSTHQHLVCAKNALCTKKYAWCSPADTTRPHQIETVATHSGWASLIQRTFSALLMFRVGNGDAYTEDKN